MLRATKKNDTSFNVSILNSSSLTNQTTTQTMQRQIDNYTRKLEQDKRKFFRAQQNYSDIKKQFDNKNKELQKLKSKKNKSQLMTLKGKIGTLEATLDQSINSYNQSLSKNNKLKCQIDQLRKQKKNQNEKLKFLTQRVEDITCEMQQKQMEIQQKKSIIQRMKQSIIHVKQTNQSQLKQHQQEIHMIKHNFQRTSKQDQRKQKEDKNSKTQNIDTQPVLKLRLRNLIAENKGKIKIIDQYKKNMHLIFQNFQQIKEQSGIQDLQQITKTFLKQEEQNLFIYQYMSRLNSNIQSLQESNEQIRQKISQQHQINKERRINLTGTPQQAKRKRQFESYKQQKSKTVNQLKDSLQAIKPKMLELLKLYNLIDQDSDFDLNQGNIEMYISQIQDLMNNSKVNFEVVYKGQFKQDITRYTKLPPSIADDSKQKPEERLLQKQKLKEIAGEYWQKKKAIKMTSSKSNESTD